MTTINQQIEKLEHTYVNILEILDRQQHKALDSFEGDTIQLEKYLQRARRKHARFIRELIANHIETLRSMQCR